MSTPAGDAPPTHQKSISAADAHTIFNEYLLFVNKAFESKDIDAITGLFLSEGWLRE